MGMFNVAANTVSNWVKRRVEDFQFWYGKAKDEFKNGHTLQGIKNIGIGVVDVVLHGELSDTYEEAIKPALNDEELAKWKENNITNADANKLAHVYSSMSEYASVMSSYSDAVNKDNGIDSAKSAVKDYVKDILSDEFDETSPYASRNLTSQLINGQTSPVFSSLIADYEKTKELTDADEMAEKQSAIIEQIADAMISDTDSMIKENGAEKMSEFFSLAQDAYSEKAPDLDRYEQSVKELGIVAESQTAEPTAEAEKE